jgi:branched-chain amino acid transport system ATP-binding protein/branched-chain amino acid transport system permease protein
VEQFYDYATLITIYSVYALSLNLLLGYAGQLSVAHAAFGAVGGYLAAYLATTHGWGLLPGLLVGALAAGVVGLLASLPALYLDIRFLILLTLALSTAILAVIGAIPALGGQTGLTAVGIPSVLGLSLALPSQYFWFGLIVALLTLFVCWRMAHSPFGRVLRGLRDDEIATRGVGKNIVRYKVTVFGATAAMAGAAGVLLSTYNASIQPSGFDLSQSMMIIAMVVIGGTANLLGSILGASAIVLLDPFLTKVVNVDPDTASLIRGVIYGSLIALFMLVRPQGLIPERWTIGRLVAALRRRRAAGTAEPPAAAPALAGASVDGAASTNGRGQVVLEASGLKKYFGGIRAADDLGVRLCRGEVTGLIGPNGAGKTTVFNLLTRVIAPDAGTVVLRDHDVSDWTPNRIAVSGMSRSYQDVRIFGRMSVLDNVMIAVPDQPGERLVNVFLRPLHARRFEQAARARAMEHLSFVGLADRADAVAGSLPFGDQKLLALARLLATEADVLLLDEPASGIDVDGVERMLGLIAQLRDRGKCVCIVEHNLHVVERVADRVYFMEAGKITAEGRMSELMKQERLAEVYFGSA